MCPIFDVTHPFNPLIEIQLILTNNHIHPISNKTRLTDDEVIKLVN